MGGWGCPHEVFRFADESKNRTKMKLAGEAATPPLADPENPKTTD